MKTFAAIILGVFILVWILSKDRAENAPLIQDVIAVQNRCERFFDNRCYPLKSRAVFNFDEGTYRCVCTIK